MPLRMIEVLVPASRHGEVQRLLDDLEDRPVLDVWHERVGEGDDRSGEERLQLKVLVRAEHVEAVLDDLEQRFGQAEGFRASIVAVEASIPRPTAGKEDGDEAGDGAGKDGAPDESPAGRISREELYNDVREIATFSTNFIVLMFLATVVAVIGLVLDNVAIIIGSMVIAPLLGPSVGLALSTTLADRELAVQALKANVVGIVIATVVAIAMGFFLAIDPAGHPQVDLRTRVTAFDVGLGLAVGSAGVLSVTTGVSAALVGVMVAVALLPPLAVFGLMLGSGHIGAAQGAFALLLTYLISVNLAGVATFLAQGIRPRTWWEAKRARRATVTALALWISLLALLVGILAWLGVIDLF